MIDDKSSTLTQRTRVQKMLCNIFHHLVLQNHPSEMWKFADDTTVSEIVEKNELSTLQMDIDDIATWSMNNSFQLNPFKCKEMVISFSRLPPVFEPIRIGDRNLERVTSIKSLGQTM